MAKKQFKAESKRLLEMMINSIYTQREIFLRELISNASDAIDKIYYKALTDDSLTFNKEDYYVKIIADKANRTLTITDTGIGMTKEDLENNLGVIAKSGSLAFKSENEAKDGHNIIGQFGRFLFRIYGCRCRYRDEPCLGQRRSVQVGIRRRGWIHHYAGR